MLIGASILSPTVATDVEKSPQIIFNGNTLYVGGDGPSNYTSIQAAIDNASNGDMVFVFDDSSPYYDNIIVNKSITLLGENENTTIIDGNVSGTVINILADSVNVSGFTIQNCGNNHYNNAGIFINSNNNNISRNRIINNTNSIFLVNSDENSIYKNVITQNTRGPRLQEGSTNNTITSNNIEDSISYGILLMESGSNTVIENNIINNSGGILFRNSISNTVRNNTITLSDLHMWPGFSFSYPEDLNNDIDTSNTVDGTSGMFIFSNIQTPLIIDGLHAEFPVQTRVTNRGLINLYNCSNVTIKNCLLSNNTKYGIYLVYSENITITKNNLSYNGDGIHLSDSDYNTIIDNSIVNNSKGIDLSHSYNNNILENNITNNYDGVYLRYSEGNTFRDNIITISDGYGFFFHLNNDLNNDIDTTNTVNGIAGVLILLNSHSPLIIDGFHAEYPLDTKVTNYGLINLFECSNVTIKNCRLSNNSNDGIFLSKSDYNTITDNSIAYCDVGTSLSQSDFLSITNNSFTHNSYGIYVVSDNTIIAQNNLGNNNQSGIIVFFSENNNIYENNISNNGVDGILQFHSSYNSIFRNNITNNEGNGITLFNNIVGNYNVITGNNIINNNGAGIYLEFTTENKIYHNNFINNTINAYDNSTNHWNDGYPSGGNYWDNYTGCDVNGDGIGDIPYDISGASPPNQDLYPLVCPWGENHPVADFIYSVDYVNVSFNASSSYDRDGIIEAYEWDFGDDSGIGTTFPTIGHTYGEPGIYEVILIVRDNNGFEGNTSKIITVTGPNNPPDQPNDPNPENGAIDISIDIDLSWTGGDPDPGDIVTYDVFFDTSNPPTLLVSDNQSDTFYDPEILDFDTTYYWQIVAWDNHGASTEGSIWMFTTEAEPIPNLDCDGSLSWTEVKPDSTVQGSFTVENIGDPETELDWEIETNPEWGTWTFTPSDGEDLTPEDGSITIDVSVVAPDESESEFDGEIKIVNSDDPSDFCIIDVSLATPQSHQHPIIYRFVQFIKNLLERFPLLERILEQISTLHHFAN